MSFIKCSFRGIWFGTFRAKYGKIMSLGMSDQHFRAIHPSWNHHISITESNDGNVSTMFRPVNLSYAVFEPTQNKNLESPSIIILHGLLGSKTNWKSLAKVIVLQTHSKVFTTDARNHGDSPHSDEFNYPVMAVDIEHFMKKNNIAKSVIIGHSMGGRTAMLFALTKPELVHKLVVVDVSPVNMPDDAESSITGYFTAMKDALKILPSGITLHEARKTADSILAKTIPESGIRQFLLTNVKKTQNGFEWLCNLDVLERNLQSSISRFSFPSQKFDGETLFICGQKSNYVKESHHPQIYQLFPRAEIVYISDAGHWVHSDKPAEVLSVLKDFILKKCI